jgi:hypothetical protein
MISMHNKLCNKQDGLFSFNKSYLHKGQGSPNEFEKTYKTIWSHQIVFVLWQHFHILWSIFFYNVNSKSKSFHKLQRYYKFI